MVRFIQVTLPLLNPVPGCSRDVGPEFGLYRCRYVTLDFILAPGGVCCLSSPNLHSSVGIGLERWLTSHDAITHFPRPFRKVPLSFLPMGVVCFRKLVHFHCTRNRAFFQRPAGDFPNIGLLSKKMGNPEGFPIQVPASSGKGAF